MSEEGLEQYGGILAAPPRHPVRRVLVVAVVAAALVLVIYAAVVAFGHAAGPRSLATPGGRPVVALAYSPDGKTMAVDGRKGCTYLQNTGTGRTIATLTCRADESPSAFSPDGKLLALTGGPRDETTFLINVSTRRQVAAMTDPAARPAGDDLLSPGVDGIAFSPDAKILAASDGAGRTYVWSTGTGRLLAALADPDTAGVTGVTSVAFSPDGRTLATGDISDSTCLWDTGTWRLTARLTDPGTRNGFPSVQAVAFSPDGRTLAVADGDDNVYLWDPATRRVAATLSSPLSSGYDPSVCPDEDVCGDPESDGDGGFLALAFSPGGTTLAVTGNELARSATYLWNVSAHQITATLADPAGHGPGALAFSPSGTTLAAIDDNGRTYLWPVHSTTAGTYLLPAH